MPGVIRRGSGNLGLTGIGDGERMLHGEMEQVAQKLEGGEARRLYGEPSSTCDFRLRSVKGSSRRQVGSQGRPQMKAEGVGVWSN